MYSSREISAMFHLCETGCDGHVLVHRFCDKLCLQSRAHKKAMVIQCPGLSVCNSDVTISRDSHRVIPKFIASIVVVFVPMCGECWLA